MTSPLTFGWSASLALKRQRLRQPNLSHRSAQRCNPFFITSSLLTPSLSASCATSSGASCRLTSEVVWCHLPLSLALTSHLLFKRSSGLTEINWTGVLTAAVMWLHGGSQCKSPSNQSAHSNMVTNQRQAHPFMLGLACGNHLCASFLLPPLLPTLPQARLFDVAGLVAHVLIAAEMPAPSTNVMKMVRRRAEVAAPLRLSRKPTRHPASRMAFTLTLMPDYSFVDHAACVTTHSCALFPTDMLSSAQMWFPWLRFTVYLDQVTAVEMICIDTGAVATWYGADFNATQPVPAIAFVSRVGLLTGH